MSQPLARVTTKTPIEGGTAAILAELQASTKIAVAPPAEAANAAFAYDDFGTPGKIVSDERVEDLGIRSEEHTSELQSLMRISYAVFCLKKKKRIRHNRYTTKHIN